MTFFSLRLSAFRALLWCPLIMVIWVSSAWPQPPAAPKPSDVRIVIDISGSMKKNDPQNLRRPALDMLVKLLPEGSQAGVWTFGQYVNMLVKHRPVDEAWKQEAIAKSTQINSVAQFTNIGEALEKAAYDQRYSTKGQYQTHVILLTDGMVDIDREPSINTRERNRILEEVLPGYQQVDYTVHTISLSENADRNLMDRLALATNGQSVIAKDADELMKVFLQVFDQAVPKEELPLAGNSFLTDSSIEEFTALIFPQPGSPEVRLIAPDNTEYRRTTTDPTVSWYHTDRYDLITVKRPLEGEWRINAQLEPQSRITVVSDLSLAVKPIPVNLLRNQKVDLSLALREDNKVVSRAEFLDLLDIDVTIRQADGDKQWQQRLSDGLVPGNGIYSATLDHFQEVGQFDILVTVDGKSFQRRFSHRTTVREPFAVNSQAINRDGKTLFKITVSPQTNDIDTAKTEVVGKLKDPTGASVIKPFTLNDQQVWELLITPEQEGTYYLTLRISATDKRGKTSDIIPEPLSLRYPQGDNLFGLEPESEPAPVPAAESTPETVEDNTEEVPLEEDELYEEPPEEGFDFMQWALYGILAVVNILIILVIYILYRKLFGIKKPDDEDDDDDEKVKASSEAMPAMDTLAEPPMDEMIVDELSDTDTDIDLSEDEPAIPAPMEEDDDPFADLSPEALDDDDDSASDDEDPEFSLDDFAPDALDDDSEDKK